ncbi:hypothetical protein SAMN05444858_13613 [Micromonospora avicenniae]|uniref:Putative T7SS secretion signal domain-containing protein n=2 Tax=Micromonospora avicenniae TaxID=1198245 RepID=A0A1N7FGU5_9ACTN|nr:hypothetical protein SAMN05444858_13613 [Micromonospora avicenniae]
MARPGAAEWSVLELDSDPVPGDPESFEEITRAYQELARTTQEAHDLLASGGQIDVGQGKAMEAFKDLVGKLPPRLDKMAHSYAAAADAYLRYLPSLEEAQTMSLRALEQARQASTDQGSAQAAVSSAQAALTALTGDTDAAKDAKDKADDDLAAAQRRTDDARQALDQAKSLLGQATALRDQAARTAAEELRHLAKDAPQRSLWEKIAEAFKAFIEFLRSTVIEWLTTILDVLSTIAFFIFPPLGEAIGFLSGAIELGAALLTGNPAEIGLAAGGLALGLVPGGRLVGKVMKFALKGTIKDGIKTGTKQLTDVPTTTGTKNLDTGGAAGGAFHALGPGKVIKGKLDPAAAKIKAIRNNATIKYAKIRGKFDKNTIVGWDDKNNLVVSSAKNVKSEEMFDSGGKQVGVLFRTRDTDFNFHKFAASDVNMAMSNGKSFPQSAVFRSVPDGRDMKFQFDASKERLEPAPWNGSKADPNFVVAHGTPQGAFVSLKNGKVIQLPGGQFAKVLNANQDFKSLTQANPQGPITLLSCNFGKTSGTGGQAFADAMKGFGDNRQIFAATDSVFVGAHPHPTAPGHTIGQIGVENMGKFVELKSSKGAGK